jgi:hypothetical protein
MIHEASEHDSMMLHCIQAVEEPYRAKCYENRSKPDHWPVAGAFARQPNKNYDSYRSGQNHACSRQTIALQAVTSDGSSVLTLLGLTR